MGEEYSPGPAIQSDEQILEVWFLLSGLLTVDISVDMIGR